MKYSDIQWAIKKFSLPERVTLKTLRNRYRELSKLSHPDTAETTGHDMAEINRAYQILEEYTDSYQISFSEDEYLRQYPEEMLFRQFADDPVWGGGKY